MLASTDTNINHPLQGNQIDLNKHLYQDLKDTIDPLPVYGRKEFDLIQVKDPNTIYYVREKNNEIVRYQGNLKLDNNIERFKISTNFCLMINDENEYCIYRLEKSNRFHCKNDRILMYRYKNVQDAINKLSELRKIGSGEELNRELYELLISYFNKYINIQDTIFGIMTLYGLNNHISFQPTIILVKNHDMYLSDMNIYCKHIHDIVYDMRRNTPTLIKIYYKLLQVFVKYNYFNDKKYSPDNLDEIILTDEINDIIKTMNELL